MYFAISFNDGSVYIYNATTFEIVSKEEDYRTPGISYSSTVITDYVEDIKKGADKEITQKQLNKIIVAGS